ncbi:MAG: homoserine dehydrogenase [Anaerolineae bacterium]|nr:homoserine dehydrogenase [Anaerolineae bacterium]
MHEIRLIFLGFGNVGSTLLRQVLETRETVASRAGVQIVPIALADISGVLYNAQGLPEETLRAALQAVASGRLLESLPGVLPLDAIRSALQPGVILADLTASPHTVPILKAALDAGCGLVLANKLPLAAPWEEARIFFEHPKVRWEVTVGAGLPVIATLNYLLDTGDQITAIEGCMSGTLGYLCSELEQEVPYSSAVRRARELGYTEPDPREDLSGMDVARKALILARTAGWPLDQENLAVESLYPRELASLTVDEFLAAIERLDEEYAARRARAWNEGNILRYVARVTPQAGMVGLTPVPRESALGMLRGPGNHFAFYTARYNEIPLVICGPGAGREVTAAGVLGDIIELGRSDIR